MAKRAEFGLVVGGVTVQVESRREAFMGNAKGAAKLEVLSIGGTDVGMILKPQSTRSTRAAYQGSLGTGEGARFLGSNFDRDLVVLSIVSAHLAARKETA